MQRKLVIALLLIALITVIAGPAAAAPGNGKGQAMSMTCDNTTTYSIWVGNGQWASVYVADGGRAILKKIEVAGSVWGPYEAQKPNWEKQFNAICTGINPAEFGGGTFTVWLDLKL